LICCCFYLRSVGHEKELIENKLEQERKTFEVQMKTLLIDYDKILKDNQSKNFIFEKKKFILSFYLELLTRYNETKSILHEYEKKSQISSKSTINEFPNPQRVKIFIFISI